MGKLYLGILLLGLTGMGLFSGCKKFEKTGVLKDPGVVLTFDDNMVDNWYQYLPVLDSAGVKATFYVCKYNRFTNQQKEKLRIIQQHGHEIAFHSTNHYNMVEYVYKFKHPLEDMLKCEIEDGLKLMNKDGFYPTTFAYPYGAHNAVFDKSLNRYFKSVRALNGSNDYTKSLATTEHNDLLYGLGIDKSSNRRDADIMQMLKSAKDNNNCAVLVAHNINTGGNLSVSLWRLKKIFEQVNKLGLKYYTVSEISN
ncbi:MAG: polysaccharide deacetylase family protein [Ferruginibacter sp.]